MTSKVPSVSVHLFPACHVPYMVIINAIWTLTTILLKVWALRVKLIKGIIIRVRTGHRKPGKS